MSYKKQLKKVAGAKDRQAKADALLSHHDPKHHLENHFKIKDKDGRVRWFGQLKSAQNRLLLLFQYCWKNKLPVRVIVLKARKEGISTQVEALLLRETLSRGIDGIVIAHDKETAKYIFSICDRFYQHYDLDKPPLERANVGELKFAGQEGYIVVQTANNKTAGTGMTPQFIHCSEVAKWAKEKATETAVSLFQSIGDSEHTTVILESTAYGLDPLFFPHWQDASENCRLDWKHNVEGQVTGVSVDITNPEAWNGYLPLFIPWFEDPDYVRPFPDEADRIRFEQVLSAYDHFLIDQFGLTLEQLNWRHYTKKHKCGNDENEMKQEYPATPQEAFISSGRPRFDIESLDRMPIEPGRIGMLRRLDSFSRSIGFDEDPQGWFELFEEPVPGHEYVIGVDVAEGKLPEGGRRPDASVAIVLDRSRGCKQVCTLSGQISEEVMVAPLILLAEYFNGAYIVCERNSTGKHVCIQLRKQYPRRRLFNKSSWNENNKSHSQEVGWLTSHGTRPSLISRIASYIHTSSVKLQDAKTVDECRAFHFTSGGRVEASPGKHDDHVMALGMAIIGNESYPDNLEPFSLGNRAAGAERQISYRFGVH